MDDLSNCLWVEFRKARRSVMPLATVLGNLLIPMGISFLMFVYKDPEYARQAGLIGEKANLIGGSADWPFFLSMLVQAGIMGLIMSTLVHCWTFGREFVDGTMKDLLALPVSRLNIVLAKYIVATLWSLALAVELFAVGILFGSLIRLPMFSMELLIHEALSYVIVTLLSMLVVTPIAFLASVGRGYLLPIGIGILAMITGNILASLGWGHLFPWAIPAIYADAVKRVELLTPASYWVAAINGLAGILATHFWWNYADQHR